MTVGEILALLPDKTDAEVWLLDAVGNAAKPKSDCKCGDCADSSVSIHGSKAR